MSHPLNKQDRRERVDHEKKSGKECTHNTRHDRSLKHDQRVKSQELRSEEKFEYDIDQLVS